MTWHRFKDGVMVEGWDGWNQDALMQQLREGEPKQEGEAHAPPRPGHPDPERRAVAARIREIRRELFGEHGGPELARRLNLPARTWYNYETGVTVPAEVLLRFLDQTGVNPVWLLSGDGPRYRRGTVPDGMTPIELIRRGLEMLEGEERGKEPGRGA